MVVSYQWYWMVASKCPNLSAMVSYNNNLVNRSGQLSAMVNYNNNLVNRGGQLSSMVSYNYNIFNRGGQLSAMVILYKYNLVISNGKMSGVWSNISGVWSVL